MTLAMENWGLGSLSQGTTLPHKASMGAQTQYFESSHSTSLKVRLNVPWVEESDAHEETRPCECPQLPQAECTLWCKQNQVILDMRWLQLALAVLSVELRQG